MRKTLHTLIIFFGVIIFILIGTRLYLMSKKDRSVPETLYGQVGNFRLTDQLGNPVELADLRGHVWVADFVFSRCMGPCPLVTSKMASLQKHFSADKNIRFVSFSVDPTFDSPAVLKKYAESYNADPSRWFFLTGDRKTIYGLIRSSFHLAVENQESKPDDNDIVHSLHLVVVDRYGVIRGYFNSTDDSAVSACKTKIAALINS